MRVKGLNFEAWPEAHRRSYDDAFGGRHPKAQHSEAHVAQPITARKSKGRKPRKRWKDPTHLGVQRRWGLWLDFLSRHGVEIKTPPGETISKERLDAFIRELLGRVRYSTAASYIRDIGIALREMQPGFDLSYIRSAAADLDRASTPLTDELTRRTSSSEIYERALARMDENHDRSLADWRAALAYLDGLKLAIFVLTSIRLRTMALTQKRHFKLRGAQYVLVYRASETKTKEPFTADLPAELTARIEQAFEIAEWLARKAGKAEPDGIWVTRSGVRMSHRQTHSRCVASTEQEVGIPLGPQRLRRQGPTSLKQFAPFRASIATSTHQHHARKVTEGYAKATGTAGAIELHNLLATRYSLKPKQK